MYLPTIDFKPQSANKHILFPDLSWVAERRNLTNERRQEDKIEFSFLRRTEKKITILGFSKSYKFKNPKQRQRM